VWLRGFSAGEELNMNGRSSMLLVGIAAALLSPSLASAAPKPLQRLSTDPYTDPSAEHATEVEPDTFAFGSTVVVAFQAGRHYDAGANNNGFATSTDGGNTWSSGFLPGLTQFSGGNFERATDPSVAYDSVHDVWMIASLVFEVFPSSAAAIVVNRSTDGGLTWGAPVFAAVQPPPHYYDKEWITCDNVSVAFRGHCYISWSDDGNIVTSTSVDGGLTWGPPVVSRAQGTGVQPVVQPNGTLVIVAANSQKATSMLAVSSRDGGASFGLPTTISSVSAHTVKDMRAAPIPSAEVDGNGRIFVAWQDCRFHSDCPDAANDIVLTHSDDGLLWSPVERIPIEKPLSEPKVTSPILHSNVEHFIPGLGVDPSTSGDTTRLALTYYYYPNAFCGFLTCRLNVGFVSSANGGGRWTRPVRLNTKKMSLDMLADADFGGFSARMVGDYISTSWVGGTAVPAFALAFASDTDLDEAIYSTIVTP
jgi:hypothetical protein